ncbi:outer membrane lipoprotein carrier protein LolA [Candidatus Ulvibacter alkanivorans]|uniref:outer membrane lipoprotein carrier protein LolA n=1 Tax=Candidatus Ulvibacter alkanivorans TaxID=2267620 RepID=UPI000DF247C9|nr:outer membrane lipoprotein carrier protein LolA [Candidatus Ulvibacter alkanivorans]
MIHKHILIVLFTFLSTAIAIGQEELSEEERTTFKEKVRESAQNTTTIVSDFKQTKHVSVLDNDIVSKGKLKFKDPNKVKWSYTEPFDNTAIFKNNALYVIEEGKTNTIDLGANKIFKSLNSLIVQSIKGDMFDESQFDITYFKTSNGYLVRFAPIERRLRRYIAAFELQFTKDDATVVSVRLIEPNSDFTHIEFVDRKQNVAVGDSEFKH